MPDKSLNLIIDGTVAGRVVQNADGRLSFAYDEAYRGPSISVSMPIAPARYQDKTVRPWLLGLLPDDRAVRRAIAHEHGVSSENPVALLAHVGLDCPGAVQLCTDEMIDDVLDRVGSMEAISDAEVRKRLEATLGANPSWVADDESWSLGDNQGKLALRLEGGQWHRCVGSVPTTHIIKPGIANLKSQALVEFVCMRLAAACGITAADVSYHEFDGLPAIIVERYDRVRDSSGCVRRIHQEDFCQALSVSPDKKYTSDGGPTVKQCIGMLAATPDAQPNVALFLRMLFFNTAICAPDAHAKNYSLLHISGERALLAPLYDVASGLPYETTDGKPWRLAMSIGGENRMGKLRRSHVEKIAGENGLSAQACCNYAADIASNVCMNVSGVFDEHAQIDGMDELRKRLESRLIANCERMVDALT